LEIFGIYFEFPDTATKLTYYIRRGILHDERLYKDPEQYTPERFLGLDAKEAKKLDPSNYVYGFGRR
jgi:cytochrome P450